MCSDLNTFQHLFQLADVAVIENVIEVLFALKLMYCNFYTIYLYFSAGLSSIGFFYILTIVLAWK